MEAGAALLLRVGAQLRGVGGVVAVHLQVPQLHVILLPRGAPVHLRHHRPVHQEGLAQGPHGALHRVREVGGEVPREEGRHVGQRAVGAILVGGGGLPQHEAAGGEQEEHDEDEELRVEGSAHEAVPLDLEQVHDDVLDEVEVLQLRPEHYQVQSRDCLQLTRLETYIVIKSKD